MKKLLVCLVLCYTSAFADTYFINLPEKLELHECEYNDIFDGHTFGTRVYCKGILDGDKYEYYKDIYPTKAPVKIEVSDGLTFDSSVKK